MANEKLSAITTRIRAISNSASRFYLYDADGTQSAYGTFDDLFGGNTAINWEVKMGSNGASIADGSLTINGSATTGTTPNTAADDLVIDGTGNRGMTGLIGNNGTFSFLVGNQTSSAEGGWAYDDNLEEFRIRAGTVQSVKANATGLVIYDGTSWGSTLDRYNTSTWTPTIEDSAGNSSAALTTDSGLYTRIGDDCFGSGSIVMNGAGSLVSGNALRIEALPFTAKSGSNFSIEISSCDYCDYGIDIRGEVINGSTYIRLLRNKNNQAQARSSILVSDIDTTQFAINFTFRYQVA